MMQNLAILLVFRRNPITLTFLWFYKISWLCMRSLRRVTLLSSWYSNQHGICLDLLSSFSSLSLLPVPHPNANKFVFLSPFLLRRLQSIWTITPQGSSHSLQVSQGFIHKKGESPPRGTCVHCYMIFFPILLYCGRIIWPAACSNRPSVTIFDNSSRMNETLPGMCQYRSFSRLHSFFFFLLLTFHSV